MKNAELFAQDPLTFKIPNEGITTLGAPRTEQEWDTLRWELSSFVCEGQYAAGMKRLLTTYLENEGRSDQPGWWVSGFYGSGKSHFVRVLEHLWADTVFPDGARARELVQLTEDLKALLLELTTVGRREGGLWAASGTLGASAEGSVRLGFASILFRAAGLPESYPQARLVMWLMERGVLEDVRARVAQRGEGWEGALNNLFVSPALAQSLLEVSPDFGNEANVRQALRTQFAKPADLTEAELLGVTAEVMALMGQRATSSAGHSAGQKAGKLPCTLVIIDEVQQFIGDNTTRVDQVARLAESMTKRFGGRLLLVATGQSAMNAMPQLAKIKDRFPRGIELSSTDVEQVVRAVILRKDPAHLPRVEAALDAASGEIARHLEGTPLASREADHADLARDYPILPTRRRLWDRFLQTIDSGGSSTQLRSQLRIMLDASRAVADRPLGFVIGGEFVYRPVAGYMRSAGALLDDTYTMIELLGEAGDGGLRQRVAQLLFILGRLDPRLGVKPTEATLADLLVEDLQSGSQPLRAGLGGVLRGMVESGYVMKEGELYRLQTREGAEWNGAFGERYRDLIADAVRQTTERASLTRDAVALAAKPALSVTQGVSRTGRKAELHFEAPPSGTGNIPVWVRFGWNDSLDSVKQDARQAGQDSPVIHVFIPEPDGAKLQDLIATKLAATDVLTARPTPTTEEARQARSAMLSRRELAGRDIENLIARSVEHARVIQGGGQELEGGLRAALKPALDAAVARLYPHFAQGDHARWDTVRRKALEGDQTALEKADFMGPLTDHPVVKALLAFTGAGKKGTELRRQFTGVPYGWPQEAVDAALILLTLAGHLRASLNGSPVEARQLDGQTLPKVDFRPETVVLTTGQRLAVRGLYGKIGGVSAEPGKEAAQAGAYLARLQALVAASGGEAPRPEPLSSPVLSALSGLSGNDLLLRLAENAPELQKLREDAQARAEQIARRLDHWEKLTRLLRHNTNPALQARADAIREHRLLLSDPDQVVPLAGEVMNGLRADLKAALEAYADAHARELADLGTLGAWPGLNAAEQAAALGQANIPAPAPLNLASINDVVDALDARPLGEWQALTEALPTRFARLRADLLRSAEPRARPVRPPRATLKTEAEVETYLRTLREDLLGAIQAGDTVLIV